MKIGILTLPLHTNYGGILQAYALQTVLERMGHETIVYQRDIMPSYKLPFWKKPLVFIKRILKKFLFNNIPIFLEREKKEEYSLYRQNTNSFIYKNIHICTIDKICDVDLEKIDAIIVGSDQIWRPSYVRILWKTDIQDAYLNFTSDWSGKRIAYAASFGVSEWEYSEKETKDCGSLIKNFNAVSVREDDAADLCRKAWGITPNIVLDPTLLLDIDSYYEFIDRNPQCHEGGILFSYILDETMEKQSILEFIANERKLTPYNLKDNSEKLPYINKYIVPPVEKWLQSFYDANFIVTDSFHGCVFSIIFGKPFVAIANDDRGISRFMSLFKKFGLENHLIRDLNDYHIGGNYCLPKDINAMLIKQRQYSLSYLQNSLS